MKSKFTSVIMFLIILAIIGGIGLLGIIIFQDLTGMSVTDIPNAIANNSSEKNSEIEDFEPDISSYNDTVKKEVEVPKIRTTENQLEIPTSSNSQEQVDYNNIIVNKYFYNQLEESSKLIYKAFEQNKDNMKSGTYKVNLGDSFSNILSKESGQDELANYYQSAIEAYMYDNPDVFYLNPNRMYLNIETTTKGNNKTYNTYIDSGDAVNYLIDEFSSKYQVEDAIKQIEEARNKIISQKTSNDYENIKLVHDYLVDSIEYDVSLQEDNIYNIYGALVNGKCVCEGYSKALKYLLDGLGIESTIVIGKGINSNNESENHAWNYVKFNNTWYAIDATWDDPVIIGGGYLGNESKYRYFLKGNNTFEQDHYPSGRFTEGGKIFTFPTLSVNDY